LGGIFGMHWTDEKFIQILVGKYEGMRWFGGIRHRWEANTANDLIKTQCEGVDCSNLIQNKETWQ
jgi:hypothetical protein